jgi:hypothetical protein
MKGADVHTVEIGQSRNAFNFLVLKPGKKGHAHEIQRTKMAVEEITYEISDWSRPVQNID